MTRASAAERRPGRPPRRPTLRAVAVASGLAFVIVLALLAAQMRLGRDPVLGARRAVAEAAPAPRRALVRHVIVKRIVVHEVEDADDGGATPRVQAAVVATRRAVTPAAPAARTAPARTAAPAPAPVPASAPLVTKSS